MSQQDRATFFSAQLRLCTFLISENEKCGGSIMAVKFTSVECPSCGAHLSVEEGREKSSANTAERRLL